MLERVNLMPMQSQTRQLLAAAVLSASVVLTVTANTVDRALEQGVARASQAQQAQQHVNTIDADIRELQTEYRTINKEIDGLNVYLQQLDRQLQSQQRELAGIENSIQQVTLVERQITPLMLRMIEAIELFVQADVPFLQASRQQRVAALTELMGRADVTVAEKYRKVMEAYQIEVNYGRTIESYRGTLTLNDSAREVDFLRVGRVSFMYTSLDGQEMGVWNNHTQQWQRLDASYKSKLMAGIRIAREQAAPSLIQVPVAAPQESK